MFQCFTYKVTWLTTLDTVWHEVEGVLNHNIAELPDLPDPNTVDGEYLTILSCEELAAFGSDARQVLSSFHVIVETESKMYKVIATREEEAVLRMVAAEVRLCDMLRRSTATHFILPVFTGPRQNIASYDKVPYGPLEVVQASKYLRTISEKISTALEELHGYGFSHGDVRLPNVCFNSNYDVVLIDLERCTPIIENGQPHLCMALGDHSCLYRKPEMLQGILTAKRLDYIQLGWLLVWVLHDTGDYHEREWEQQPGTIVNDVFLSQLVCQGVYSKQALELSVVRDSDHAGPFCSLFHN